MSTPWKDPKSGVYKIRRGIPEALRPVLGKREYQKSLGTKDPLEAKRLFPAALEECERVFDAARAQLEGREVALSDQEAAALAGEWLRESLVLDLGVLSDDAYDAITSDYEHIIENEQWDCWSTEAADVAAKHGLPVAKGSEAHDKLCREIAWAALREIQTRKRRQDGDWRDDAVKKYPKVSPKGRPLDLTALMEDWSREAKPDVRRTNDMKANIRRFEAVNERLPVGQIRRDHFRAWKDAMVKEGLAPNTTNRRLSDIRTLLSYAVDNGIIEDNPGAGIVARGGRRASKPRVPFTKADLQKLFAGPVHGEGKRYAAGKGEAQYWLPLLALYTGARLSELGQLRPADVRRTEEGIAYLDLNDDGEKSLKTESSRRRVPLHRRLIALGFLEFVQEQTKAKAPQLFPGLTRSTSGQFAKAWGQWFGRYKDKVVKIKAEGERKDFHSFRHTFKDAARDAGIPEEIHDTITGHAASSVGRSYGGGAGIARLKEELDKLEYRIPKLNLK